MNIDKAKGGFVRFQYTTARVERRKRRLKDQSSAFKKRYRWRAGVAATMSRLKYQMRLAHLRVAADTKNQSQETPVAARNGPSDQRKKCQKTRLFTGLLTFDISLVAYSGSAVNSALKLP